MTTNTTKEIPSREGCTVIEDGYTRLAYLDGAAFTTPAVRFKYRSPLVRDLSIIRREIGKAPAAGVPAIQADTIAKYVAEWSVTDERGDPVPLTRERLLKVHSIIFDGVSSIVLGLRLTDIDPEWIEAERDEEFQRSLAEVFGGDVVSQESTDAKN